MKDVIKELGFLCYHAMTPAVALQLPTSLALLRFYCLVLVCPSPTCDDQDIMIALIHFNQLRTAVQALLRACRQDRC